jgi:hypothetical protein
MSKSDRPRTGFILSLVGGVIVLLFGVAMAFFEAIVSSFIIRGTGALFGSYGMLCGIGMMIGGTMMNWRAKQHTTWGAIVVVFSFLSLGATGGLIAGFFLGLLGGVLGITWRPHIISESS